MMGKAYEKRWNCQQTKKLDPDGEINGAARKQITTGTERSDTGRKGGGAVVGVLAQTLGFPFVVSGEGGLLS